MEGKNEIEKILTKPIVLVEMYRAIRDTELAGVSGYSKEVQVTETVGANSSVKLSVEVPTIVCEDCYQRVLFEFMKRSKVPGFRPGKKVPENIIVGFVGRPYVLRATVESILKRTLPHAMDSVTGRALKDSIQSLSDYLSWC